MIAKDLSKQQQLDAYQKAIQRTNFTESLKQERNANATMLFITEEAKETVLDFSRGNLNVL